MCMHGHVTMVNLILDINCWVFYLKHIVYSNKHLFTHTDMEIYLKYLYKTENVTADFSLLK